MTDRRDRAADIPALQTVARIALAIAEREAREAQQSAGDGRPVERPRGEAWIEDGRGRRPAA